MKGLILEKGEECFTLLKNIFDSINNIQKEYNWLVSGYECYPQNIEYSKKLSGEYCWMTGDELTNVCKNEDCQWIWGVFSGFHKSVNKEDVLKNKLSQADGYTGFWQNPISIQHPLAEIEIVAWDSSLTIIISKDDNIIEEFRKKNLLAEDLEKYNE